MTCYHPLKAFDTGCKTETGKREIFVTSHYSGNVPLNVMEKKFGHKYKWDPDYMRVIRGEMVFYNCIDVPCGHCIGCQLDRSKDWAVRCCLEASLYPGANWFLTLTYDDFHYPDDGKIHKEDLQKFMKRLRKKYPGVRYFACGEYGGTTLRPHYHLILFNFTPSDLQVVKRDENGVYYASKDIELIWNNGFVLLGEVTFKSCAYVARYAMKAFKNNKDDFKPFLLMSRDPGIGHDWIEAHWKDVYNTDTIFFDFGDRKIQTSNRYFDGFVEKLHPEFLEQIKDVRFTNAQIAQINNLHVTSSDSQTEMLDKLEKTKKRQIDRLKRFKV